MDNQYNQSEVAYGNGPKEVNNKRGMHDGNKQFGKHKMPQDEKSPKIHVQKVTEHQSHGRHKEHR